jgi:two-component system, NarL family, sensor histidine kinase DegS
MTGPYTPRPMDAARSSDETRAVRDVRIDGLRAEASEAVSYGANTLRAVSQRYRQAYADELARWQSLRNELDEAERAQELGGPRLRALPDHDPDSAGEADTSQPDVVAFERARVQRLRSDVDALGREIAQQDGELAKFDIALQNLESMWLFLERGDSSLVAADAGSIPSDLQMRIVEAQESERSRLAREVHDGPAQVLSNAIFQVEYIQRVIDTDLRTAKTELRFLRDLLRRELGSVRTFISQLRPPVLDELGLEGAIADAIGRSTALTGLAITSELNGSQDRLSSAQQTVALRVLQEALQNVRKHGGASAVTVATAIEGDDWVLTVRDDGRGFDVGAVAARGRRNFGLQFMRERAELIGARFEVQSRPDGGTLVRLAIPVGAEETS